MSHFEPRWKPPLGLALDVCSEQQIEGYVAACLATRSATISACDVWSTDEANLDCISCIVNPYDSETLGPLTIYTDLGLLWITDGNPAQCMSAFEGDSSDQSCGAKYDAGRQCAIESCRPGCRLDSRTSFAADLAELNACIVEALGTTCAAQVAGYEACYAELIGHGDPIDQCIWTSGSFDIYATGLIIAMCGAGEPQPSTPTDR